MVIRKRDRHECILFYGRTVWLRMFGRLQLKQRCSGGQLATKIWKRSGVVSIQEKMRESRLRWFAHAMRDRKHAKSTSEETMVR